MGRCWVVFGSFLSYFQIVFGWFSGRFWAVFESFSVRFRVVFGSPLGSGGPAQR